MSTLTRGSRLGPYRLVDLVGSGGIGQIWRAFGAHEDHPVAVKIFHSVLTADVSFSSHFGSVTELVCKLSYPGIVHVRKGDEKDGHYYLVMDFIEGQNLETQLGELAVSGKQMELREAVRIIAAAGEALDYAHSQGLFHLDVKPSNILCNKGGEIALTDFGVVNMIGWSGMASLAIRTPQYCAPELIKGPGDERSDIYSLGIVLYELITGCVPYSASTAWGVMLKHMDAQLPSLLESRHDVSPMLEGVVYQALAPNPDGRFPTAAEMVQALRSVPEAQGEPEEEAADQPSQPAVNVSRTRPLSDIPRELCEQMRKDNVVLFVGAGLSIGAGLPGWEALIRPLAEQIGYTRKDWLKAAQYYENRMARHALVSYLRDKLVVPGIEPTEVHHLLARLPVNIVFTTNFDDLLERAYRRAERPINLVVGATELSFWDESKVNLVKLHGTCDQPKSIVITERDYNTIYRRSSRLIEQLNALLATKTFLLIGYSVNDPDFNQIYDQLRIDLGAYQRRPYLLTFDVDEFAREDLEERGYHVISLPGDRDRNARLADWLRALLNAVSAETSSTGWP